MNSRLDRLPCALALLLLAGAAWAEPAKQAPAAGAQANQANQVKQAPASATVKVERAWVRATVPGQRATGGFMQITASEALQLVALSSPAAGLAEIHEMKMEQDVMRMRAMAALALPAGQTVALQPGGHHVMLMDLAAPLPAGSSVLLRLVFKDARGATLVRQIQVPVSLQAPADAAH